jgi:hypothetical protein
MQPRRPSRYGIAATTLVAATILVAGGTAAVVLYPSLSGAFAPNHSTSTWNSTSYFTTITSYTTLPPTTSSASLPWTPGQVANATLGSPQVQAYIHDAWNFTFGTPFQTGSNPVFVSTIIGVIGLQTVSGNWSTAYNVTYSGIRELNVTVQMIRSGYFQVVHMSVWNSTDSHGTVGFTSDERNAIAVTVVNSSVKAFLSQHPSYVGGVAIFPSGNGTYGGDYLVTFFPINGTQILNAFVTPTGHVVATYTDTRAIHICISGTYCYNDPWVVNGTG